MNPGFYRGSDSVNLNQDPQSYYCSQYNIRVLFFFLIFRKFRNIFVDNPKIIKQDIKIKLKH